MRYIAMVFFVAVSLACSKGKVSEANLTGHTYSIKMKPDPALANSGVTTSMLGLAKMEFMFQDNHAGIYRSGVESMTNDIPIKWTFLNDSIIIEQLNQALPRIDRYAISRIDDGGYFLSNSRSQFELIKK